MNFKLLNLKSRNLESRNFEPLVTSPFAQFTVLMILMLLASNGQALTLNSDDDLQAAIDQAGSGDVIHLSSGIYRGNFILRQSLTLSGDTGAILDGGGFGDTLRVTAPDVVVRGLSIRNWGDDLTAMNAGIFVEPAAVRVLIENNNLQGDVTGIWLERSSGAWVLHNRVEGNTTMRSADRGNGIQLNLVTDVEVRGNEVWHTRDGLYIISSQNNLLIDNTLHDVRYGVHYMYSHTNTVENNRARNTRAGFAFMQSRELTVINNVSENSQDYGILLNFITDSLIKGNRVDSVVQKRDKQVSGAEGKALFVYNSLFNRIDNNCFSNSQIGVHLTAGSENNTVVNNSFVHNAIQVKYVASRTQQWSSEGQGNYWSNYLGWDTDSNGLGDVPFEPNDGVDKLLWKYPQAKVLMHSPAVLLLRWVQQQFPVLKSPGVKDSFPLMNSPFSANNVNCSGDAV
jgi:nitrous oxidase accessory protein